jgi:hypothetical protein
MGTIVGNRRGGRSQKADLMWGNRHASRREIEDKYSSSHFAMAIGTFVERISES